MKKEDLRDGMVVETRDGRRWLVLGDRVIASDGFNWLRDYRNDLTMNSVTICIDHYDIMRVYTPNLSGLDSMINTKNRPIWERKEPKELTVAEIEELLGYPIKVVK